MIQAPSYFEAIRARATHRWEQLEADPDLAGPWHQLFKQVQSPRHVLSELLQNADDAGATEASVDIVDGRFIFSHNGEDFREEHFASLCRFGYSNKRALHTIGFRGIGFKSTFSLGDTVELNSPTLAIAFDRQRFTAPRWIAGKAQQDQITRISVQIGSEHREREIEKNLQEWIASPISLLFFKHVRRMRVGTHDACWAHLGAGPVPDSEWMGLQGAEEQRFLIIRSQPESFPEEALAEIRHERMLGADQEMEFPPCKVEIVLGAKGRLFVVLPTGVETKLPFACNAPFIQDPARMKIKDPETSPTNFWLLQRVGKLAAEASLHWLNAICMPLVDRAKAYGLLPDVDRSESSLEADCGTIAEEAYADEIAARPFLLTHDGKLVPEDGCLVVPSVLFEIWAIEHIVEFFDDDARQPLAEYVSNADQEKLINWGFVRKVVKTEIVAVLQEQHLPRPESWGQLLLLWRFVAPELGRYRWNKKHRDFKIVPVQGKDELYSANEVVRLGEKRLLQSEDDWVFLSNYLLAVNQNWPRFLADQRRSANEGKASLAEVESAYEVLNALGLDETSDANSVVERVASGFFAQPKLQIAQCIQIGQIAAKLGAIVGESFRFVTEGRTLMPTKHGVLFDHDGRLSIYFQSEWNAAHFLHSGYSASFSSCTSEEWQQWLSSGKSGLLTFAPLENTQQRIYQRKNIAEEVVRRGGGGTLSFPYVTNEFRIDDWDFESQHWKHWKELATTDPELWGHIVDRILNQPESWFARAKNAKAMQRATNGNSRAVTSEPLTPAWILKLRELPCLLDTRGIYRRPSELLRRTPETESLMDVELFVHGRLDTEATRWLLVLLRVRDVPTGPERLLECLRALAQSSTPPVHEVEKWYRRLDQMLEHCSTNSYAAIRAAFRDEKIILTNEGEWSSASGVFLGADEEDVPGAALIRGSVSDLMLWRKIDIADRPTVDRAIQWLQTLSIGQALTQEELKRVQALLRRHPKRIWQECNCWLNMAGEWVAVDTLKYGLSMQSLVAWTHLHKWVKQATAHLLNVSSDILGEDPFSSLHLLGSQIEERFNRKLSLSALPVSKPWLTQLGVELQRYHSENETECHRIRELAVNLSKTLWQVAEQLETIPYIDGLPAGTARRAEAVWVEQVLYVEKRPMAKLVLPVAQEIGKAFQKVEIVDAIKFCIDRPVEFVSEYMEENFKLLPRETSQSQHQPEDAENPTPRKSDPDTASVQDEPKPDGAPSPSSDELETEISRQPETQGNTAKEPIEEDFPPAPEATPEPTTKPSPKPPKTDVLELFAKSHGFRRDGDGRYVHADGRCIAKSHGGRFPWELLNASGQLQRCLLPKAHCLQREPLQLEADVWGLLDQSPETYALILESLDGKQIEVSGTRLGKMRAEGQITLYPATYRLVFDGDNQ